MTRTVMWSKGHRRKLRAMPSTKIAGVWCYDEKNKVGRLQRQWVDDAEDCLRAELLCSVRDDRTK